MLESKGYSSEDIIDVNYGIDFNGINLNAASFDHPKIKTILEDAGGKRRLPNPSQKALGENQAVKTDGPRYARPPLITPLAQRPG